MEEKSYLKRKIKRLKLNREANTIDIPYPHSDDMNNVYKSIYI